MIRAVSFDMDGTIVNKNFANSVWFEAIPKLYSQRWKVPFEVAVEKIKRAYDEVGPRRLEWYDIKYWFRRFDLGNKWDEVLAEYRNRAQLYPDVEPVLQRLAGKYKLIIATAAAKEFANMALNGKPMMRLISGVFSSISDFGQIGKTPEFFRKVCEKIGVKPSELLHVGDHLEHDVIAAREAGIHAILIDRDGKKGIKSLFELIDILSRFDSKPL
ncbi:MAG: HAD family hydrolase [Candidatus Hadarchaeales archaeon]